MNLCEEQSFEVIAGTDESGCGDTFGPVTVAAVRIDTPEQLAALEQLSINDSKKLSDAKCVQLAASIREILNPDQVADCVIDNVQYNKFIEHGLNLNAIKARGHLAVIDYINSDQLQSVMIDQFAQKSTFLGYANQLNFKDRTVLDKLQFETKADGKYIAVSAASIIARAEYVEAMQQLNKLAFFELQKSSSSENIDAQLQALIDSGLDLRHFAKLHFKNVQTVIARNN